MRIKGNLMRYLLLTFVIFLTSPSLASDPLDDMMRDVPGWRTKDERQRDEILREARQQRKIAEQQAKALQAMAEKQDYHLGEWVFAGIVVAGSIIAVVIHRKAFMDKGLDTDRKWPPSENSGGDRRTD